MSEIELAPLADRLDDDEIKSLNRLLAQAGVKYPPSDDQVAHTIATRLNEEAVTEFLDRLDAHDLAANIYLPVEFDGRLTVGEIRFASTHVLLDVLEEMKDELDVEEEEKYDDDEEEEEEEEDEEDDEDKGTVIEAQLRNIWQLAFDACSESLEKNIPLHIRL